MAECNSVVGIYNAHTEAEASWHGMIQRAGVSVRWNKCCH